jgi:hypothetical protein
MWKRTRQFRHGHPRLPVVEALEERRLLTGGLLGGIIHLSAPLVPLTYTATISPVPAGTVSHAPVPTPPGTPGPSLEATTQPAHPETDTAVQTGTPVTVASPPPATGLPGVLSVVAAVTEPPSVPVPLSTTTGNPATPKPLSSLGSGATPATRPQDSPALGVAVGVDLGALLAVLPDLGVSVTVTTSGGQGQGTGTGAGGSGTLDRGGGSGEGAKGGLHLGVGVDRLLDATVGVLLGGTGPTLDPGGTSTGTPNLASGEGNWNGAPGPTEQPPPPVDTGEVSPPGENGDGSQTTVTASDGGSGQEDSQPPATTAPGGAAPSPSDPGGKASAAPATAGAVAGPASGTGAPVPVASEASAPGAGDAGPVQQATEGADPRAGVNVPDNNVQDNAPHQAAVTNPGPAPFQLQLVRDAAIMNAVGAGMSGTGTGSRQPDGAAEGLPEDGAPEIVGELPEGPPGSPEVPASGTVPLSQGEGLVSGFLPFDARTLGAGLRRFLEQLKVSAWQLPNVAPSVWLLTAAALAAAGEVVRRRWRRVQTEVEAAEERRETFRWFPDLGHTEEDA